MLNACQAFLIVVLCAAAVLKLLDRDRFLRSLTAIPWLPLASARRAVWGIPAAELGVAGALGAAAPIGAAAALAMILLFTAVILVEVAAGRKFSCACFGGSDPSPPVSMLLARNGVIALAAVLILTMQADSHLGAVLFGMAMGSLFVLAELGRDTLQLARAS